MYAMQYVCSCTLELYLFTSEVGTFSILILHSFFTLAVLSSTFSDIFHYLVNEQMSRICLLIRSSHLVPTCSDFGFLLKSIDPTVS